MNLLEIALFPDKGRGYKATTDISAGTTVHVSVPLATTVSQEWTPETCMWCFAFSWPKKQKIKAFEIQEQALFLKERGVLMKKKKDTILKDVVFCSQECKSKFKSHGYPQEWNTMMTAYYKLEEAFKHQDNKDDHLINIFSSTTTTLVDNKEEEEEEEEEEEKYTEWIDMSDDKALSSWLDMAWDTLTNDLGLYREIQDADKSMCRLIATCIVRKQFKQDDNTMPTFNDLLVIQNNEITHFKYHLLDNNLFPHHPNQLPILSNKQDYINIIPLEILKVMALYCWFARALMSTTTTTTTTTLLSVDHLLFRSIYFRENANSFGLWEHNKTDKQDVTDDQELLGWGIYPSAVYFNHSCDANIYKVRQGREMVFITRRIIYKGQEACISYGCVDEDVTQRRARLLEHYHFFCQCIRCIEEEKDNNNK